MTFSSPKLSLRRLERKNVIVRERPDDRIVPDAHRPERVQKLLRARLPVVMIHEIRHLHRKPPIHALRGERAEEDNVVVRVAPEKSNTSACSHGGCQTCTSAGAAPVVKRRTSQSGERPENSMSSSVTASGSARYSCRKPYSPPGTSPAAVWTVNASHGVYQ